MNSEIKYLESPSHLGDHNEAIAYKMSEGGGPTLIWCGGLKSDMEGGKATHLHQWAAEQGRAFVRFDYYGHGASSGAFKDGTISRWGADVVTVMDELTEGDVILIGSSMGGWASLLAALSRPEQVKGLVLIAPAPDFTEKLMWAHWPEEVRNTIMTEGVYYEPSGYEEPYEYSRALIEDGRENQLLDAPIAFKGPVRILQGIDDEPVPWDYAYRLIDALESDDVTMTLVKNGDHSLSRPEDLARLVAAVEDVIEHVR